LQHNKFSNIQRNYNADLDGDGEIDGNFPFGGPYADEEVLDEKFWLAVELYGATADKKYKNFIDKNLNQIGTAFLNLTTINYDWRNINYLGIYSLYNIAKKNNDTKLA